MDRHAAVTAVLTRFAAADPELANGFAEHAPMGADALLALGVAPDVVVTWAAKHQPRPLDPASALVPARTALVHQLEAEGWRAVLAARVPALLPQAGAHLFHGLIRTAHAVRAIEAADDEWTRTELATALAGWAAWAADSRTDDASPTEPEPLDAVLGAARRGAGAFAAQPSIFSLHAVTAPMAYLLLAPHLAEADHAVAARAFAHTHRRHPAVTAEPTDELLRLPDAAARRALAERWDAHPAKLTEAAVRGYEATGDAVFLRAAATV